MSEPTAAYPPERHFLRDLDIVTERVSADRALATVPLHDATRNAAGAASLGFLTAVVDVAAAMVALSAAHPDWTATANLSLHATGWLLKGPVTVASHLVRAGSNIVIVGSDILDGSGERAATSLAAFARLPRTASVSASRFDPTATVGQRHHLAPGAPPPPGSLIERSGVKVVDAEAGTVELHKRDYVINSFGSINGGVLGVVFQAAAEAALPDLVATDVQIHYLRQAGRGPARTATTVLRRGRDHAICAVEAVDAGADDRVLALSTVTLQRPPAG